MRDENLAYDSSDRTGPHNGEQCPAQTIADGDDHKWSITAGDQEKNGAMVEHSQPQFSSTGLCGMVNRGNSVSRHQASAEYREACDMAGIAPGDREKQE